MNNVVDALDEVFAGVPHVMFCIKDMRGAYVAVNAAFADRAGRAPDDLLGCTVDEIFPSDLATSYRRQDAALITSGRPIRNELETILRPDGTRGWYVTTKTLLRDAHGSPQAIVAVSYDLQASQLGVGHHHNLHGAIEYVRANFASPIRVTDIAAAAALSVAKLERAMRRTLGMTPTQLLIRTRLDEAIRLLDEQQLTIAEVAAACGFYDQSSFTRLFRRATGMTPGSFRARGQRR
jgi:PAS domain S-box-containing protein